MKSNINQLLQSAQIALNKKEYKKAEINLKEIIQIDPENRKALHVLGVISFTTGNLIKALEYFGKVAKNTEEPEFLFNFASVLLETGQYSRALKEFNKILKIIPDHTPTLNKCITILGKMGELTVAEKMCRMVIKLDPSNADNYNNLGNICKDQGKIKEAIDYYRKALSIKPHNNVAGSNLLLSFNYLRNDPQTVFDAHREWEKRNQHIDVAKESFSHMANPDKPCLTIGYVSADFRIHSVGYFVESIMQNHNKKRFKILCYADISAPDVITERIKKSACTWRSIYNVSDKEVISMIKNDGIDILVDLMGHSGDNRLSIFLNKPAPIQVTYLGYPNTTGLSTMDYRITDGWADPEGEDKYYTEELYRLPEGFLCYKPPDCVPYIEETPVKKNGYITFGSFNNLAKLSAETISVWSEIVKTVPGSKLVIKNKPFNDKNVINNYCKSFTSQGIDRDRLFLKGHSSSIEAHLSEYNNIDIALDTFPYNGTTTTCEALLMGTPVITLPGSRHAGRVGGSILSQVGLTELIASNRENYIGTAIRLSKDIQYIKKLNQILQRNFQSLLCNGPAFTRSLETAYQDMWVRYCSRKKSFVS